MSEFAAVLPQRSTCETELVFDSEPPIALDAPSLACEWRWLCHLFGTRAG